MKFITRILPIFLFVLLTAFVIFSCGDSGDDDDDDDDDDNNDNDDEYSSEYDNDDYDSLLDTSEMFTDRDQEQTADTSDAEHIELGDGDEVSITSEGVYVISGNATDAMVVVDTDNDAKVQLVLDGLSVTNEDNPVVYVKSADKVFITTTNSNNYMEVSEGYASDGDTNLDAVIFSKDDLVLNGTGTLQIVSANENGVTSKNDLKITGGTLQISSDLDSLEAKESIRISGGELTIDSGKDALHSEDDEDDQNGFIYISGGTLNISAEEDGIQGTSAIQIDGGSIDIATCTEGIEGTYIQINKGDINIYGTDDGINAAAKSSVYNIVIEVNGGNHYVEVGSGDTDAFDSNGDIYVNGGMIDIVATSAFDFQGVAELNGGLVTVNGEVIDEIVNSGP